MTNILATASTAPELLGATASTVSTGIFDTAGTIFPYAAGLIALIVGYRLMRRIVKV